MMATSATGMTDTAGAASLARLEGNVGTLRG
jgi:hypothetical protein